MSVVQLLRIGFLKKEPQGLESKCMISCLGSCRRVSVINRGWEASEKEWALNVCYPESSATMNMMVSAKSRLSYFPSISSSLLLTLGEVRERGQQGWEETYVLKEEGKKTNHASLPPRPAMLLLKEEGNTKHPTTPSKLLSPQALIFQSILHPHLRCLELGDGQILKISSSLTVTYTCSRISLQDVGILDVSPKF